MNRLSFVAWLLVLAFNPPPVEAAAGSKHLVVLSNSEGLSESNERQEVYPAEVVSILRYEGDRVWVQRLKDQASIYQFPESEWHIRLKPIWLPRSVVVSPAEFAKVPKWHAYEVLNFNNGPDAGGRFVIRKNGAFTYSDHRGNAIDDPPPRSWRGHLYRKGSIIWARRYGSGDVVGPYRMLHLHEGELCMPGVGCLSS